ncbi:NADH-quinone oxidoreductase subunit NuoN [Brevibacillus sp. B_LB10_24]|uniref:NADH-quinone oxidoreductase subunit NuoN n=1 Tax=Brevibacillus sp. B_LB10_24 TaxID=3380645 RepID=UPI0038BBE446
MDVKDIFQYNWSYLLPEFTILGFATLLSLIDLGLGKRNRAVLGWLALAGVILAGGFVLWNAQIHQEPFSYMNDMLRVDSFGNAFKLIFLGGVAFSLIMSQSYMKISDEVTHRGEYYYLMLTALLGAMIMASSADLITLFVGLELLSISSYIMVGLRKKVLQSNEASFKYLVTGAISSAIILFGMSYVYGLTGSTNLYQISQRLAEAYAGGFSFLILLSFAFLAVGLSFKISTVPNYMWTPDVYQGAPTPITAFLTVVSKAAGFAIVIRLLLVSFVGLIDPNLYSAASGGRVFFEQPTFFLSVIAALSMIFGNTLALRQTNVKRMMAYSGIAQAGYLLVPFVTLTQLFFEQTVFYLFAYLLMSFGAFAIIMAVTYDRKSEDLKSFAGLYHRSPLAAVAMTIFMLSLAGIPVTAGFFGKFYIFISSVAVHQYWLAAVMIGTSVISYYYYFGFIRQMYMRPGNTEAPLRLPKGVVFIVAVTAIATVVFGAAPELITQYVHHHFNSGFDFGNLLVPSKES